MAVRHKLNQSEINKLLTSPQGPVAKQLIIRGLKVQTLARKNLSGVGIAPKRVDTGLLRASIATQLRRGHTGGLVMRIGTPVFYSLYVHEGTGVYGPRMMPIKPVTHRYLRFRPKGSVTTVYAKQVRGMKRNRFLTDALTSLNLKSHAV